MNFSKFIRQFNLSKIFDFRLESFAYSIASRIIVDYNGGVWEAMPYGALYYLDIPGDEPTVTLSNPLSGVTVTVNRKTASLIYTFLMVHWFWEHWNEQFDEATQNLFSDYVYALKNIVYDSSSGDIDKSAFFKFTD